MSESLTVPATIENLAKVLEMVSDAANECGFSKDRVGEVQVATEEAFVNVCRHAYKEEGDCTVSCSASTDALVITLVDEGKPFSPVTAPTPDTDADVVDRPIGGLGILLIQNIMDEMSYKRDADKNILTMTAGPREDSD